MRSNTGLAALLLAASPLAFAQSSVDSAAPAATTVAASSTDAGAPLFHDETVQLTDAVVENIDTTSVDVSSDVFSFGDNSTTPEKRQAASCKTFPGDAYWPKDAIWDLFNKLLGGALIKTVPSAAPCYRNWPQEFNTGECSHIQSVWTDSHFHVDDPTSIMWPLYQGRTCLPTSDSSQTCTLGGYPSYAVNVTNVAQIQLAINFARNMNIRFVVKNTGHDFNGKSGGAGALSVWTHHLKQITYLPNYQSKSYSGKAIKVGSGVQAEELYAAAKANGVTAVGGEGRTVGVAGGFFAGGGHSPLSSIYGLGADQIVAFEVVTPDGRFVTATDDVNSDLFWALRGGGGSTFGVVTSVIVKCYPVIPVVTSSFTFSTSPTVSTEAFWAGVRAFFDNFITYTNAGGYSYFWIIPLGGDQFLFQMVPMFFPNHTIASFTKVTQPWFNNLTSLGINVSPNPTSYNNFYDAWWNSFPLETVGAYTLKTASRLFPKSNWQNPTSLNATFDAIRNTTSAGHVFWAFNIAAALHKGNTADAANPAWRNTVLHAITAAQWTETTSNAEIISLSNDLTNNIMSQWRAVSPGAGAYMSESDISEPNFQQAFYGTNYARLLSIKKKFDPWGVFYAPTAVGSEEWVVKTSSGLPDQNGRLCRA